MKLFGAVFADSMCAFVIMGSKKMKCASYDPYRNVRVNGWPFGGGSNSGDVGSAQCAPIIGTPPGSLMVPNGRYCAAGKFSIFVLNCGSAGEIAIWALVDTVKK